MHLPTTAGRRRPALAGIAVAAFAFLAACGNNASSQGPAEAEELDADADLTKQSLVVSNWAGYMPKDLPKRFQKEVGAKVSVTEHATNEEIVAKLTASSNPGIDVAFVSGQFAQALNEQGLLAPIDHDLVPNLANLYPEANELESDPGNTFSVPYTWGTTGLCYRSDLVKTAPTSWNDLLNPSPELDGKTTMMATDRWMMLPAQKSLGYSVNTTDEAELDAVKEQLLKTKDTLLAFDDTTFYSRLVSGEALLVEAWDGWCNYGIAENPKIKFVVPEEGSDLWADTMVILNSSKNKEAAHAFIDYILKPEIHSWAVENILYNVPSKPAMEMVDPALAEQYPTLAVPPADLLGQEQLLDLGDAGPRYTEIVQSVLAKN